MLPTREEAMELIRDGVSCNPGPWGKHCFTAAHCAERIARACPDLDGEKAYILGLLHDIGRKFGVRHLGHVSDGYTYMKSLGYDEAAKVCLTHSFNNQRIEEYIGKFDVSDEEMAARKAKWQPREPRVTTGYLARYAAMVTSGNRGAILEVPKAK